MLGKEEIEKRFMSRTPTTDTVEHHRLVRRVFIDFAEYLDNRLPEGRAKSLALTELENSAMWAHKAIAQDDPINDKV